MELLNVDTNGKSSSISNRRANAVNTKRIIEKITAQFQDRSRKDIQKWRTAIAIAESVEKPNRNLLINLYNDLLTDGHLHSQIELRKAATLNTPFQVIDRHTGDVNIEKTSFFESRWFYDLLSDVLDTIFFGHTLIEFTSFESNKANYGLVPRQNVVPNKGYIIPDFSKADNVINYKLPEFEGWLLEVGKSNDLGVLNRIVPNIIWKRNIMQTWAEFTERFGIPLMTATTIKQDDETLDLIEGMIQQLGEASHAVFPQGTEINIKEANRADAYMVFDKKIIRNNEEISKAITGGTMLSDGGSSKSQSEVHERGLVNRLSVADKRKIAFIINDELFPILINRGFNFTKNDQFRFDNSKQIGLKKHFDIVNDLMNKGYDIDQSWLSKTFNIPIVMKKEVKITPTASTTKPAEGFLKDDEKELYKGLFDAPLSSDKSIQKDSLQPDNESPNKERLGMFTYLSNRSFK